jgi:hypothetical protein
MRIASWPRRVAELVVLVLAMLLLAGTWAARARVSGVSEDRATPGEPGSGSSGG